MSVALVSKQGCEFSADLSRIVAARIEAAGHRCLVVKDGDPQALAADRIVLLGNLRSFGRYRMLLRARSERPRTVLWEFDPLPPRSISRLAERVGVRAARLSDHLAGLQHNQSVPWARAGKRLIPWLGFRFSAAAIGRRLDGSPVRPREIQGALGAWASLKQVLGEEWLDAIYVTSNEKVGFLRDRGVACGFAPVGWAPGFGEDRGLERDIDVLFLGLLDRSRRRRWHEVRSQLEASGAHVVEVSRGCYGEERTRLLNRTRILVHLHHVHWDNPWLRWGLAASCGALVVSEPLIDPEPMRPGVDHVEAPLEAMSEAILERLADPMGSARMVASCRERLREALSVDASVARVLGATQAD